MKKLLVVLMALSLVGGFSAALYAGSIIGSVHDFSGQPFSGGQICVVCHAPHNVATPVIPPLWNHDLSTATYTVYSSPTLDAGPLGPPTGSTKLCLSCHDGTVALGEIGLDFWLQSVRKSPGVKERQIVIYNLSAPQACGHRQQAASIA